MRHNKSPKPLIGLTLVALLSFGCGTPLATPTVIAPSSTPQAAPTSVEPTGTSAQPTRIPPTPMPVRLTATPAPVPTTSSLEELGKLIGITAQQNLTNAGSPAQVLQVNPQNDGSLMVFVVDDKSKAFDQIALSFASAIYLYRKDPAMPSTFKVLVMDSASILTGKARGLGELKLSDVVQWSEGKIGVNEFLARINFRTQ